MTSAPASTWVLEAQSHARALCEERIEHAFDHYKPEKYTREWKMYGLSLRLLIEQLEGVPGIGSVIQMEPLKRELQIVNEQVDVTSMTCHDLWKSL